MQAMKKNAVINQADIGNRAGLLKRIYQMRAYYLLLLPFMAFLIVFRYAPMYGITLAFKNFRIRSGILGSPWAGMKYFNQLFQSLSFF